MLIDYTILELYLRNRNSACFLRLRIGLADGMISLNMLLLFTCLPDSACFAFESGSNIRVVDSGAFSRG